MQSCHKPLINIIIYTVTPVTLGNYPSINEQTFGTHNGCIYTWHVARLASQRFFCELK
jgi:hypothetical protein